MAKRTAVEGYSLIPEGEQVLKIKAIDDSKYQEFDKLIITFEDENGNSLKENFIFTKSDGTPNETADRIYTKLGRFALNDQTLDEIDFDDFPGCFVLAEIEHSEYQGSTYSNIKKFIGPSNGFSKKTTDNKKETSVKKTAAQILAEARAKKTKTAS